MFRYEKMLEYPINIKKKDLKMAKLLSDQLGGPKSKRDLHTKGEEICIEHHNDHKISIISPYIKGFFNLLPPLFTTKLKKNQKNY